MKKIILIIIILITIQIAYAQNCEDRLDNGSSCLMITPDIMCSNYTYDIINIENHSIVVEGANLSLMNNTVYYFNFSQEAGNYIIQLCDYTTREFRVTETYDEKFEREVKSKMQIAIAILLCFVTGIFMFFAFSFNKKATLKSQEAELTGSRALFKDSNWFKALELFCILFILFSTILLNNTAKVIAEDYGASSSTISMFNTMHIALIAATILFTIFMLLRFMMLLAEYFRIEHLKKEMGEK